MDKVLATTKSVVEKAKYVKTDQNSLEKVCEKLNPSEIKRWTDETPFNYEKLNDKNETNFILIFNSINFCYWPEPRWKINYQEKILDGAWAMMASLRRAIEENIPITDANYLEDLNKSNFSYILRGESTIPLFEERLNILHEIGSVLNNKYSGKFVNVIESSNKNAIKLLDILTNDFPSYYDSSVYKGEEIFFHKRAQLAISDIYRTFNGNDCGKFNNIEELTAFADYKIPQSLRKLGILEYNEELSEKIDNKMEIPKGSEEEIEIRANQIQAIEKMKNALKSKISQIKSMDIDSWLWLQGQVKSPNDKPYHRTRTIYY